MLLLYGLNEHISLLFRVLFNNTQFSNKYNSWNVSFIRMNDILSMYARIWIYQKHLHWPKYTAQSQRYDIRWQNITMLNLTKYYCISSDWIIFMRMCSSYIGMYSEICENISMNVFAWNVWFIPSFYSFRTTYINVILRKHIFYRIKAEIYFQFIIYQVDFMWCVISRR